MSPRDPDHRSYSYDRAEEVPSFAKYARKPKNTTFRLYLLQKKNVAFLENIFHKNDDIIRCLAEI